jgi:diguanylate cyclase (GGDEF)-like protein
MKKIFVSVPIKLLLLIVGTLFLIGIGFSSLSLSRLNQEFKQHQIDTMTQGQYQFDLQKELLNEKLTLWLASFSDLIHLKQQSDFKALTEALLKQFDALQLNYNVTNLWLVNENLQPLYTSDQIPKHVLSGIKVVLQQPQPLYQLYCAIECEQIVILPVVNKEGQIAVVAMTVSLIDIIYAIHQTLQSEVAIVSFFGGSESKSNIRKATTHQAQFLSASNLLLIKSLFTHDKEIALAEIEEQGMKVNVNKSHYLISLIRLAEEKSNTFYLALIDDVSPFKIKNNHYRNQLLFSAFIIFICLALLVHLITHSITKRLLSLSNAFPLLAHKDFIQFRESRLKYRQIFPDELDIVADAAIKLSYELEQLNMEVEQKTKELENIAMYDLLTGLPNRNMLNYQITKAVANLGRYRNNLAVLFLDLDDFKKVNDSHGHEQGDLLLIEASNRIRRNIRDIDLACRFSGDEFVILLDQVDSINHVIDITENILASFKDPIKVTNSIFYVTISIGIAYTQSNNEKAAEIISHADIAMHEAKDNGGAQYNVYYPEMYERVAHRVALEGEVRQALAKNQFSLSLQPQIKAKDKALFGFEALLRWHHPERGMVPPDDFIPILENSQHMIELGYWIIRRCFELCKKIIKISGLENVRIAINLSAGQFVDTNLVKFLHELLDELSLSAHHFELELTEQTLVKDVENTRIIMESLKEMGFSFAIDDFGTGYSSLAYLKEMPVDVIKIDKSFIFGMLDNHSDYQIIVSTIAMVKNLNLTVVAEGVETGAQLQSLSQNGCDIIQGYYYSKPIPELELFDFINQRVVNGIWKTQAYPVE